MKRFCFVILAIVFLLAPALSHATQFSIVGPRALGMGGASVAAVNDSTAVYWNPAALADFKKFEIRLPVSAAIRDHMDLSNTWDRINAIYALAQTGDSTALTELRQLILDLDKPNSTTDIDASAGVLVSIPFGRSTIAVSALGIAYAELYPMVDTYNTNTSILLPPDSITNNNTEITGIGIAAAEPAVTFSTAIGEQFFIGANAKMIQASTFVHSQSITTGDFSTFIDNLDASETRSSKGSIDAGILFKPMKSLNLGLVGRYLNSPSFPIQGLFAVDTGAAVTEVFLSGEIELKPQYRAGIAWKPFERLTLSADYDLSKNKSLTELYEDQTLAAGVEFTLPKEIFSIRGGMYKNLADSNSNMVYTAGFGIRAFILRVDIAGAYDFDEKEGQASASLALRF
ncbi:MAG: conjugal transfer protein TraF [Nitrospirota bacterium]